jgi:radical SAM/Cys-rich protein
METKEQLEILRKHTPSFSDILGESFSLPLRAKEIRVMQVNIGRKCNQACNHCHVYSSPQDQREMSRESVDLCLDIIRKTDEIETLDLTGGAPEMNTFFTYFVEEARKMGKHVIDRCNLTILEEPGFEHLYEFLSSHEVEIIASLPHFSSCNTDRQRGEGVFEKSITALQKLNNLGYGDQLVLNLVCNPSGFFISPEQKQLEREFKENLRNDFGVNFNKLYCLNNFPINRFMETLLRENQLENYMEVLVSAFNSATIDNLMCRYQISVNYDGSLHDCDFNQMLGIKAAPAGSIKDFDYNEMVNRKIITSNHCYGCTAGRGSSCSGEITE